MHRLHVLTDVTQPPGITEVRHRRIATLHRFNKALREMRASGELDQIVQRELKAWDYQD